MWEVYSCETLTTLLAVGWGSRVRGYFRPLAEMPPPSNTTPLFVLLKPPFGTPEFRTAPVSLAEAGLAPAPETALSTLLAALAQALDHPDPRTACEDRLWKRGQSVELSAAGRPPVSGLVQGLDAEGRLLWDPGSGLQTVSLGE